MKALLINPENIPVIWDDVAPLLDRVTEHNEGQFEANDYLEPLTSKIMQLWIAVEEDYLHTVMITKIIEYPNKRVLRVIAIAGSEFKTLHSKFNDMIESFALREGCSSMELWGRKGWKKMLPDWKDSYTVFTKELKERMH